MPVPFEYRSIYFDSAIVQGRALDLFTPEAARHSTAVFFIHGGGWRAGSREIFHPLMRALVDRGYLCASTDYRLRGVNIGDQLTDVRDGYRVFASQLAQMGRPQRIFVVGSSAGAHLALLLTLAGPGACGEAPSFSDTTAWQTPVGAAVQAAPVRFEPWEDIFPAIWSSMQDIVGQSYEQAPEAYTRVSPIHHVSEHAPPILLLHAENEHMFPREQADAFVERMTSLGRRAELRVYPRTEHGFLYALTRWQQRQAFEDILQFMQSIA